jgi:predicted DNA-binding transcriptional regulator AlpA
MSSNQSTAAEFDSLLTDKDVAKQIRASVATVWRRVKDGTLPKPIKIGTLSRFPQSDILACIEQAKLARRAA